MIRLAMPKGRNLSTALAAFRAAGIALEGIDPKGRKLRQHLAAENLDVLFLKDWDVPLYVEYGIADCGVVGSDVLEELGSELLVPVRFREGGSRMSLIGREGSMPQPGQQVRLATKYPRTARAWLRRQPWGAEVLKLTGSVELGPILNLAEVAVDIVQTGGTIRANHLVEHQVIRHIAPCLVVNRAVYQQHREELNHLLRRFEEVSVVV